ncbi:MAG: putative metal-binding motif-containing protein, partial [Myxococcota bacterium]
VEWGLCETGGQADDLAVGGQLDCNDEDPSINPEVLESCNGIDDDCDGEIDQGFDNQIYYLDNDDDGFGTPFPALRSCVRPEGYVRNADDCDDTNPNINPESVEVCNDGTDDDCDGISDDADPSLLPTSRSTFYLDGDADGFGTVFVSFEACAPQSNWVSNADDCNDADPTANPIRPDRCPR